jgi:hypothetical protein
MNFIEMGYIPGVVLSVELSGVFVANATINTMAT